MDRIWPWLYLGISGKHSYLKPNKIPKHFFLLNVCLHLSSVSGDVNVKELIKDNTINNNHYYEVSAECLNHKNLIKDVYYAEYV